MDYNLQHIDDLIVSPWSKQYCRTPFPLYWQKVYDIMEKIDRKLKVLRLVVVKVMLQPFSVI